MNPDTPERLPWPVASGLVARLSARAETVAVAESLTGGLVSARLVDVPGASSVLRGAVVAYATDLKHSLLGVPAEMLASRGPVDPEVARRMAAGVRDRLDATWGVAATGVAGPANQNGRLPGTAFVAVSGPEVDEVRPLALPGARDAVRTGAARSALDLLAEVLES